MKLNIVGFSIISVFCAHSLESETLVYKITRGKEITYETWTKKRIPNGYELYTDDQTTVLDDDLAQVSWKRRGTDDAKQEIDIDVNREGATMVASGIYKNKTLERKYSINGNMWTQCAQFSIPSLLRAGQKKRLFWALSIHDMNVYEMEMVVEGSEKLSILSTEIDTIRVRIRPTGMWSLFWYADFWFCSKDFEYLRYEAVEGLPGTPPTVKELVSGNAQIAEKKPGE